MSLVSLIRPSNRRPPTAAYTLTGDNGSSSVPRICKSARRRQQLRRQRLANPIMHYSNMQSDLRQRRLTTRRPRWSECGESCAKRQPSNGPLFSHSKRGAANRAAECSHQAKWHVVKWRWKKSEDYNRRINAMLEWNRFQTVWFPCRTVCSKYQQLASADFLKVSTKINKGQKGQNYHLFCYWRPLLLVSYGPNTL